MLLIHRDESQLIRAKPTPVLADMESLLGTEAPDPRLVVSVDVIVV